MRHCMDCDTPIPSPSVLCEECSEAELAALLGADAAREWRTVHGPPVTETRDPAGHVLGVDPLFDDREREEG